MAGAQFTHQYARLGQTVLAFIAQRHAFLLATINGALIGMKTLVAGRARQTQRLRQLLVVGLAARPLILQALLAPDLGLDLRQAIAAIGGHRLADGIAPQALLATQLLQTGQP